jgi:subtilisin
MKTFLTSVFLTAVFFTINACKKTDAVAAVDTEEECNGVAASRSSANIENQYIILFDEPEFINGRQLSLRETINNLFAQARISTSDIIQINDGRLKSCVIKMNQAQFTSLKKSRQIAAIEPDRIFTLSTCFKIVEPRLITWNIKRVGYGDGRGKTAWIIDTGIDFTHPDLNVDIERSKSFVKEETSASDYNGHGTHVAGIVGALNNSVGVLGVASGAKLVSLKVMNDKGSGNLSFIINALAHLETVAKPGDVVNMSFGADGTSDILDRYVTSIASSGVYFSVAAGNEETAASKSSPARVNAPNVFTVSAVDSLDRFAKFSNYGNDVVDFAAPGVQIISTYSDGRYAKLSGTSMSAPHIAGLLLLNGRNIKTTGLAKNDPDGIQDKIGGN